MRGHTAGAGGVLDIARLIEHQRIQRFIRKRGRFRHGKRGFAKGDGVRNISHRRQGAKLRKAPHPIAHAQPISGMIKHVFLDHRLSIRIG